MYNAFLLVNAGSSSLKVSLSDQENDQQLASAQVDWTASGSTLSYTCGQLKIKESISLSDQAAAITAVLSKIRESYGSKLKITAVAHRVVHGGDINSSEIITEELLTSLHKLSQIAPLHNPPSLLAINAARKELPDIPQVAVFDTAFHRHMLEEAQQYAVPQNWSVEFGIKRYGFHGLSHAYCAQRAAEMLGQSSENTRLIICHLGHGCSASATKGAMSLDTSMGFTPLEGLMMATRSGNIDAGAVLYAQQNFNLSPEEISSILNKKSGILGVSGLSSDLRQVIAAADQGDTSSQLAIKMFCYSIQKTIAALMVSIGKADALVFTAGIGENSAKIREQVCRGISFLGFEIDSAKNEGCKPDSVISSENSNSKVLVISTREDLTMIRDLRAVILTAKNK